MEFLVDLDQELFFGINGLHNPVLDEIMYWVSKKYVWIPVYALLLYGLYRLLGWKQMLVALLMVIPLILIADQVSSSLLKPTIERLRPCHDPEIASMVHRVHGKCGGKFGFVSSHAANFFALATYLSYFYIQKARWWPIVFFVVAALVAYSRVYLGVHYPGDVIGGAILGGISGLLCIQGFKLLKNRLLPKEDIG